MAFDARDCHGVGSGDTFTNLKHLVIGKHSNIISYMVKTNKDTERGRDVSTIYRPLYFYLPSS